MFHDKILTIAPTFHHHEIEAMIVTVKNASEAAKDACKAAKETSQMLNKFIVSSKKEFASRNFVDGAQRYIDTESILFEDAVSEAVASRLDNSRIIQSHHYSYRNNTGDVDGVVTGTLNGEQYIVFCEVKHNMDSSFSKAIKELKSTGRYWEDLIKLTGEEEDYGLYSEDIDALCVHECKDTRVMFAFGGANFSDGTDDKINRNFKFPWFKVKLNSSGRCEVVSQHSNISDDKQRK